MAEIEFLDEPGVDAEAAAPQGQPCPSCGCPVEPHDRFCPACGTPHVIEATVIAAPPAEQTFLRCDNCGAEVASQLEQRSFVCAFCDSTYVVEFAPEGSGRQEPEFVIGFAVTHDQAQEKFRQWISNNSWLQPGDLTTALVTDKLKGVYLPFWSFSMLAESQWAASIGEYWYRTETYTTKDANGNVTTETRQVRETEWWPLSGRHHRYYSGFMVSGSRGLAQRDAEQIKPFHLPALKRYQPYFLAGWLAEEYSIARHEALELCQQEFHGREQRHVAAFLPGDTHRGLEVSTRFRNVNSDLCLLPVYIFSYRYNKKLYRFLVNGQTGKSAGRKPLSWKRIVAVVLGVLLLILVVILTVLVVQNV